MQNADWIFQKQSELIQEEVCGTIYRHLLRSLYRTWSPICSRQSVALQVYDHFLLPVHLLYTRYTWLGMYAQTCLVCPAYEQQVKKASLHVTQFCPLEYSVLTKYGLSLHKLLIYKLFYKPGTTSTLGVGDNRRLTGKKHSTYLNVIMTACHP